jgi:hypothetical protein
VIFLREYGEILPHLFNQKTATIIDRCYNFARLSVANRDEIAYKNFRKAGRVCQALYFVIIPN